MPPADDAVADASTTDTAAEPAAYTFPFDVPADLGAASEEDLRALHQQVREHSSSLFGTSPAAPSADTLAGLQACRDLAVAVAGEMKGRRDRAEEAAALAADIDGTDLPDSDGTDGDGDSDTDGDDGDGADTEPAPTEPTAVTAASRRPRVRDVARHSRAPQLPADAQRQVYASMTAAADVPGFSSGQRLTNFADVANAISGRLDQYPAMTAQRAGARGRYKKEQRPVTVYDPDAPSRQFQLRQYARHSVVQMRREFPKELRVRDGDQNGLAVAEYAAGERRLPGGNLRKSAELAVKNGRSLTAAAGWCAPSETIYDLLELETLDGLLDLPELQTTRGGWQIPDFGGPDFATIYGLLGSSGDTHLTEAEVIADTPKVCTEITCPDFTDVRLGVDYYCLTGGLLQRRGYPEVVARFSRAAVIALAHKINQGLIAALAASSGAVNVIPSDPSGDDAPSALLSAVELAVVDAKYRNRMSMNGTMEVVLPWWVLVPIRAAMARRRGVAMLAVSDAEILSWFTQRGAVPRFVYDWQDSFSGLATGPGGATPLTALPATALFMVYPAGTWVKAVQDVVALDTIYDSTLLETNQYTAVFAEDGWAPLQMGPISRIYRVNVDPSGVTGCCDLVGS
jgi:hypothetical protein